VVNSDGVIQQVQDQGMQVERARRKNSENRRNDNRHFYGLRHLVEKMLLPMPIEAMARYRNAICQKPDIFHHCGQYQTPYDGA